MMLFGGGGWKDGTAEGELAWRNFYKPYKNTNKKEEIQN